MSGRFMRVIVFFDLPMGTTAERREYSRFRRMLIKSGFMMMQESVYTKLVLNPTAAQSVMNVVREQKPQQGLVQMLIVTEKQFSRMEFVLGEIHSDIIDDAERLVIL